MSTYAPQAAVPSNNSMELLLLEAVSLPMCAVLTPQNFTKIEYVCLPWHRLTCRQITIHSYFCS